MKNSFIKLKKFNSIINYYFSNKKIVNLLKEQSSRYILDDNLIENDNYENEIQAFNNQTKKIVSISINKCLKSDSSFDQIKERMQNKILCKETVQLLNSYLDQEQILVDTQEFQKNKSDLSKDSLYQQVLQIYLVKEKLIEDSNFFYQDQHDVNSCSHDDSLSRQFYYCLESLSENEFNSLKSYILQMNRFDILNLDIKQKSFTTEQSQTLKTILQSEYNQRCLKLTLRNPELQAESWINLIKGFNSCRYFDLELILENPSVIESKVLAGFIQNIIKLRQFNIQVNQSKNQVEIINLFISKLSQIKLVQEISLNISESNLIETQSILLALNQCLNLQKLCFHVVGQTENNEQLNQEPMFYKQMPNLQNVQHLSVKLEGNLNKQIKHTFLIIKQFPKLQSLDLQFLGKLDEDTFDEMYDQFEDLTADNSNYLKELNLVMKNQDLKDFDAGDIGVIASNFKNIQNLNLDLSNNQITNDGFTYLLSDIQKCRHISNLQMNLSNNLIDLSNQIEEQICQLKIQSYEIKLNGNKYQGEVKQSLSLNQMS
ncbi:hypothetical protein ABPG74_010245 [Tetrahymena malaccensis]